MLPLYENFESIDLNTTFHSLKKNSRFLIDEFLFYFIVLAKIYQKNKLTANIITLTLVPTSLCIIS